MICNECEKFHLRPDIKSSKVVGKGKNQRIVETIISYHKCFENPLGTINKSIEGIYSPGHPRDCWKIYSKNYKKEDAGMVDLC